MNATPVIALTTDFGNSFYVGQMKGILAKLAPSASVIDLTHEIEPQNVLQGAVILQDSFEHFPPGTVHIAVVDPGVGTRRSIVAMKVQDQWLIGPDNGLLSGVAVLYPSAEIYTVSNRDLWSSNISTTFHGRDIMAPIAAFLANGGQPEAIGPVQKELSVEIIPIAQRQANGRIVGETLFADRYGNLISNIRQTDLAKVAVKCPRSGTVFKPTCNGSQETDFSFEIVRTYGEASAGKLVAVLGSGGRLELSVVNGSAAKILGGERLQVRIE